MMRPFETALSVVVSLAFAAAVLFAAGCETKGQYAAGVVSDDGCSQTFVRSVRRGVPVQCTILFCTNRYPPVATSLFCDEVPK